jgi:hypothetical protein
MSIYNTGYGTGQFALSDEGKQVKNLIRVVLLAFLFSQSAMVASEPVHMQAAVLKAPGSFAVSGILRSNGAGVVIKLVQGVHRAGSRDEAVGAFTQEVLNRYPGYSLVDTVVTSLPSQKATCEASI